METIGCVTGQQCHMSQLQRGLIVKYLVEMDRKSDF